MRYGDLRTLRFPEGTFECPVFYHLIPHPHTHPAHGRGENYTRNTFPGIFWVGGRKEKEEEEEMITIELRRRRRIRYFILYR